MTSFSTANVSFGGYIISVPNAAALRNTSQKVARSRGDFIFVGGTVEVGDGAGGVYAWIPDSKENDDGQQVIKPFDVANDTAGRWRWSIKAESAFFERVIHLESEVNDPTYGLLKLRADITDEIRVRMEGDKVSIDKIDALEASVTGSLQATNALISEESRVRASAIDALAGRTTNLEASVNDPTTGLVKAHARITDESTARSTADTALANRTTTLETTVNDPTTGLARANARIGDEEYARSTADTALAGRAFTLETDVFDPNSGLAKAHSRISDEISARSDAVAAVAGRTSTLESQFNGSVDSTIFARIRNEESTRASAVEGLSNRVSVVEANTGNGDIGARVQTVENAVANLNGRTAAYWQVQTVANGNRAQLTVRADANGGAGVDIVGDVSISGNLVVNGTLTTGKYADHSVTDGDAFANNNILNGIGGVYVTSDSYSPGYSYDGDGNIVGDNWQYLVDNTIHINAGGTFSVILTFKQDTSTNIQPTCSELLINGQVVNYSSGGPAIPQSSVTLNGAINVGGPSDVRFQLRWNGNGGTTVRNPRGFWQVRYK